MGLQRLATLSTKLLARDVALHSACPRFGLFVWFAALVRAGKPEPNRRLVGKVSRASSRRMFRGEREFLS